MMSEYFAMAFKNIRRRRARSLLTVFGIVISIATIFVLVSVSLGLDAAVKEQFRQLGTDKFFLTPKGQAGGPQTASVVRLTNEDIRTIERVSGVHSVSYMSLGNTKIAYGRQVRFVTIIGLPLDNYDVFKESGFINVDSGRYLAPGDSRSTMIGYLYKYGDVFAKSIEAGDTVELNDVTFRVRSVLEQVGNAADDKNIYVSLEDFETLFPAQKNSYSQLAIQVSPGENLTIVAERVEKDLLRARGLTEDTQDFDIQTPEELLATFGVILNILTGFLLGVAAISLLVGGIGITNTMYTAVLERTKEIGVMKAVGARNSVVVTIFTVESGLLGLVGGAGGVLIGIGIAKMLEYIAVNFLATTILQAALPWYLIIGSLAFSFFVGAIAGIVPALRGARIRPVQALRYE